MKPLLATVAAWGFAEATVFFIVPDVALTFASRQLRRGLLASLAALAGALAGGMTMLAFGTEEVIDRVPAISGAMIRSVSEQVRERGAQAVVTGPLRGIPYKIYAVEWKRAERSPWIFLLISIPARYARFLASTLLGAALFRAMGTRAIPVLAVAWTAFYAFYFHRFGW